MTRRFHAIVAATALVSSLVSWAGLSGCLGRQGGTSGATETSLASESGENYAALRVSDGVGQAAVGAMAGQFAASVGIQGISHLQVPSISGWNMEGCESTSGGGWSCPCPEGGKMEIAKPVIQSTVKKECVSEGEKMDAITVRYAPIKRVLQECRVSSCGSTVTIDGSDELTIIVTKNSTVNDAVGYVCGGDGCEISEVGPCTNPGKVEFALGWSSVDSSKAMEPKDYCMGITFTTSEESVAGGYGLQTVYSLALGIPGEGIKQTQATGGTVCYNGAPNVSLNYEYACESQTESTCDASLFPKKCDHLLAIFDNPACDSSEVCGFVEIKAPGSCACPEGGECACMKPAEARCKPIIPCDPSKNQISSSGVHYSQECVDKAPAGCPLRTQCVGEIGSKTSCL